MVEILQQIYRKWSNILRSENNREIVENFRNKVPFSVMHFECRTKNGRKWQLIREETKRK